ncbi:hypothetical protein [Sphingomonas humi]
MIHFQLDQPTQTAPYADAVNRLRSVRKALGLVEMFEGRPRRDLDSITFEALLPLASPAVQACADVWSIEAAGAAAAGIETLVGANSDGETTHPAALAVLGETLRRDLESIEALFAGRA